MDFTNGLLIAAIIWLFKEIYTSLNKRDSESSQRIDKAIEVYNKAIFSHDITAKHEALNYLRADKCEEYLKALNENDNAKREEILQKEIQRLSYFRYDIVSGNRDDENLLSNWLRRINFANLLNTALIFVIPAIVCFLLLLKVTAKPLPYSAEEMQWELAFALYVFNMIIYVAGVYIVLSSFRLQPRLTEKPKTNMQIFWNIVFVVLPILGFVMIYYVPYTLINKNLESFSNWAGIFFIMAIIEYWALLFLKNKEKYNTEYYKFLALFKIHKDE